MEKKQGGLGANRELSWIEQIGLMTLKPFEYMLVVFKHKYPISYTSFSMLHVQNLMNRHQAHIQMHCVDSNFLTRHSSQYGNQRVAFSFIFFGSILVTIISTVSYYYQVTAQEGKVIEGHYNIPSFFIKYISFPDKKEEEEEKVL